MLNSKPWDANRHPKGNHPGAMMSKLAAVLLTGFVAMGGWAVVTVRDLPEYFVAGQQYTIEFQVRQHGRTLLSDLRPELVVTSGSARGVVLPAAARSAPGTYAVTFTAPASGSAPLTIRSGFGDNQMTLSPLAVVAGGGSKPALSVADRGQLLFVAKGCNTCHVNSDLSNAPDNMALTVGPGLGARHLARECVLQQLTNPYS